MIQIELPNLEETNDPILKKVILAVQELADQSSSFDTAIFHEMDAGIKEVDKKIDKGFKEANRRLGNLETDVKDIKSDIKDLKSEMKQTREETVHLLKQIAENTKT